MCAARPESLLLQGSNTNVSDTTFQLFDVPAPKCLAEYRNYFTIIVIQTPAIKARKLLLSFSLSLFFIFFLGGGGGGGGGGGWGGGGATC